MLADVKSGAIRGVFIVLSNGVEESTGMADTENGEFFTLLGAIEVAKAQLVKHNLGS